jgi:acyl-CoA synthetase (AMP-forming)/AMP-acid ligase II
MKLYPEDIDLVLERHPEVSEACAFAVPDEIHGQAVAAAVRVARGAQVSVQALEDWCRERLRRQAVPGAWFFLEEIPKTERGKVSRASVRDACLGGQS